MKPKKMLNLEEYGAFKIKQLTGVKYEGKSSWSRHKGQRFYCTSCSCPLKPKVDLENSSLVMSWDAAKGEKTRTSEPAECCSNQRESCWFPEDKVHTITCHSVLLSSPPHTPVKERGQRSGCGRWVAVLSSVQRGEKNSAGDKRWTSGDRSVESVVLPLRRSLRFAPRNPACTDVLITCVLIHHSQFLKFPPLMLAETGVSEPKVGEWGEWGVPKGSPRPNWNFFLLLVFFFLFNAKHNEIQNLPTSVSASARLSSWISRLLPFGSDVLDVFLFCFFCIEQCRKSDVEVNSWFPDKSTRRGLTMTLIGTQLVRNKNDSKE